MDGYTALALGFALKSRKKRRRQKWAQQWYLMYERFGCTRLLHELRINEPSVYENFLRMDGETFDELLGLLRPFITKKKKKRTHTVMRSAISPFDCQYLTNRQTFGVKPFRSSKHAKYDQIHVK